MTVPTLAATSPQLTTAVVTKLPAWGNYVVVVSLAKTTVQESATVEVGGQMQGLNVAPWTGAEAAFYLHAKTKRLPVTVTGSATAVKFTVATARQRNPPASQPMASTYSNAPRNAYRTLQWSDEFTGASGTPANSANWAYDSGGGCGVNTLSTNTSSTVNASLDGSGNLAITALPTPGQQSAYSSAQLDSQGLYSFEYGRIEARMELPTGRGLCSAFWMVGDSETATTCWPNCGEIDIMEQVGQDPGIVSATLHGPIAATPGDGNNQQWQTDVFSPTPFAGHWHTYGLIWAPNSLTWTIDGVPYAHATPATLPKGATWVFNAHPFHIVLDLAVGGWPGPPDASTAFPAVLRVAWVRVYQ